VGRLKFAISDFVNFQLNLVNSFKTHRIGNTNFYDLVPINMRNKKIIVNFQIERRTLFKFKVLSGSGLLLFYFRSIEWHWPAFAIGLIVLYLLAYV